MKRIGLPLAVLVFFCTLCAFYVSVSTAERGVPAPAADGGPYIEATGMGIAPHNAAGAQAKALARRGAILDMQRNLLASMSGVHTDRGFMAESRMRSEVNGIIRGVQLLDDKWDGKVYTITGRIRVDNLR